MQSFTHHLSSHLVYSLWIHGAIKKPLRFVTTNVLFFSSNPKVQVQAIERGAIQRLLHLMSSSVVQSLDTGRHFNKRIILFQQPKGPSRGNRTGSHSEASPSDVLISTRRRKKESHVQHFLSHQTLSLRSAEVSSSWWPG